jgi:hypothetical protein
MRKSPTLIFRLDVGELIGLGDQKIRVLSSSRNNHTFNNLRLSLSLSLSLISKIDRDPCRGSEDVLNMPHKNYHIIRSRWYGGLD